MDDYVAEYLRNEVRESAVSDIVAVARYHARRHRDDHGHFSTPRQVFSYVDHLGYLAYGESSSKAAARFIREYFSARYSPFAELVYAIWRHGTIHQFRPFGYTGSQPPSGESPLQVWWLSTNHNRKGERSQNMLTFPVPGESNAVYLVVNGPQLADDLVDAIDRFIERIEAGGFDGQGLTGRLAAVRRPQEIETMKAAAAAKAELNRQVELAWQSRGGRLDRNLGVVEPHPENVR